jgi:hypothetical protein
LLEMREAAEAKLRSVNRDIATEKKVIFLPLTLGDGCLS